MALRRILWGLIWILSLLFWFFYRQWLAWLVLSGVMAMPIFSLLVSLPAMLTARMTARLPQRVPVGTELFLQLYSKCRFVPPQWTCRIKVTNPLTGRTFRLQPGDPLPTDACGALLCYIYRPRIYDYLGLFVLPLRGQREYQVLIEPLVPSLPLDNGEEPVFSWKPKRDGFSENHELRLYTPGDSIRQIHWKLSAKTGKLIIREPMVPEPGKVIVRFALQGEPEALNRLLGQFYSLGEQLLERKQPFDVECFTAPGPLRFSVASDETFRIAKDHILRSRPSKLEKLPKLTEPVTRCYEIGGTANEKV